jgi:WD40 repeat protein
MSYSNGSFPGDLKAILRQLSKKALEALVENFGRTMPMEEVQDAICRSLTKQKTEEHCQQENDRNSFAVVLGACSSLEVADARGRGRGRASSGLLAVGSDVLTVVSTFLAWDKVELQREWENGEEFNQCHFSPCGNLIGGGTPLKLWGAASGELVRIFEGATSHSHDCCFTPDGKNVVSADADNVMRLWNIESGGMLRSWEGHTNEIRFVGISPNGAQILSCGITSGSSHEVKLWNFTADAGGEILECTLPMEHSHACCCCSFSPNGSFFLVGDGFLLKLHDSTTRQLQHTLKGHHDTVTSCSFAPDGATILSGSRDSTVKLWCAATGQIFRTLYGHTDFVTSCAFSPTGLTIASASFDTTLRLWTTATGQPQHIIDTDSDAIFSCCFSSDGKSILAGCGFVDDIGVVKVWNASHRRISQF